MRCLGRVQARAGAAPSTPPRAHRQAACEQVHAWLSLALASPGPVDAGALRAQLGRLNALVAVLRALHAPAGERPGAAGGDAWRGPGGALGDALRLQQCLRVRAAAQPCVQARHTVPCAVQSASSCCI